MAGSAALTKTEAKGIQVKLDAALGTVVLNDIMAEISPRGDVLVFTDSGVETKPAADETGAPDTENNPISIGNDFNSVAVYGAKLEVTPDGGLSVSTKGIVKIRPASEALIGTAADDGWVYAGISPDTNKPMYVMPEDAGAKMTWDQAMKTIKSLRKQGKTDVRLPSEGELEQMFNNKAKIGGFNETGVYPSSYYKSSTPTHDVRYDVVVENFKRGFKTYGLKELGSSVRLVRS